MKTNKEIILRTLKNFAGIIAIGALVLLIAMMLFSETVAISKDVLGLLIGTAFLFTGIGGIVSAIMIFFSYCLKKIAKLEKALADKDKIISTQRKQLKEAKAYVEAYTTPSNTPAPKDKKTHDIFDVIDPLFEENQHDDESGETIELGEDSESTPESMPPLNPTETEDS